ncbi:MAG: hypothetical protein ACI854_001676 [Arenicella sp.]|jgi:hypothetical protein
MPHSPAKDFFDLIDQSYQITKKAGSRVYQRDYLLGKTLLRLEFIGSSMIAPMTQAIEHLRVPQSERESLRHPDLTIGLWDSNSTGALMPSPPWTEDDYIVRAEIKGYNDERFHTAYDVWGGGLRLLDKHRNLAFFWTKDASALPSYERGAPLRMILNWWLRDRDYQFVHAAAVGRNNGGVLLAGKGGSGKSTSSLCCLGSSLKFASDDYCLLNLNDAAGAHKTPQALSLYSSAKLELQNINHSLPQLTQHISNRHELGSEKALLFLAENLAEKLILNFPLKAILLPTVSGNNDTRLKQASSISALKALAPSTLFQLSGAGKTEFANMTKLVKSVPCYTISLGTDLSQIPKAIEDLLDRSL